MKVYSPRLLVKFKDDVIELVVNNKFKLFMNTVTLSQKLIIGTVMLSLAAFLFTIAPAAQANSSEQTLTSTATSTATSTKERKKAKLNQTCIQTAVDTREAAILKAFKDSNTRTVDALTIRGTALHDAWGLTDQKARNTAIKNAWSTWKSAKKADNKSLSNDRKSAWTAYKTTAKNSCKITLPKEDSSEPTV